MSEEYERRKARKRERERQEHEAYVRAAYAITPPEVLKPYDDLLEKVEQLMKSDVWIKGTTYSGC